MRGEKYLLSWRLAVAARGVEMTTAMKPAGLSTKNVVSLLIAAAIVALSYALPAASGLSNEGQTVLGILFAGIILWITEALPLPATALLVLILMPLLGVCSFNDAYAKSIGSTAYFLMGTFAFTVALDATSIPTRMVAFVLKHAGTDSKKVLLGFMLACALLSTVMSDVAACGVFISVGKRLLELNNAEKGKSRLGKAIMIAIPWASYAGGAASMAGNGVNVLTVNFFDELFGVQITFVQWMMLGIPTAIILLITSWIVVCVCFKPEAVSQESVDMTFEEVGKLGKLSSPEIRTIVIITLAMVCWILSSWIPVLNTAMVAIAAMVLFAVPGSSTLKFDELLKRMNWGVILMIMCIMSVSSFVVSTGAGEWIVNTVVAAVPVEVRTPLVLLAVVSIIGAITHNVVPVGPAVAGILAFPLGTIAQQFGISMTTMLMTVAWMSSFSYMLPLDCVPILTYTTGYYKMSDMVQTGIVPTLVSIVLAVALLPLLCIVFGLS